MEGSNVQELWSSKVLPRLRDDSDRVRVERAPPEAAAPASISGRAYDAFGVAALLLVAFVVHVRRRAAEESAMRAEAVRRGLI